MNPRMPDISGWSAPASRLTCGSRNDGLSREESGFSLLELMVAMFVGALLTAVMTQTVAGLVTGGHQMMQIGEDRADWHNMMRMFSQDVHASIQGNTEGQALMLTLSDGLHCRYSMNPKWQLIRWCSNGSVSVSGVEVHSFRPRVENGRVAVTVILTDGTVRNWTGAMLSGWQP